MRNIPCFTVITAGMALALSVPLQSQETNRTQRTNRTGAETSESATQANRPLEPQRTSGAPHDQDQADAHATDLEKQPPSYGRDRAMKSDATHASGSISKAERVFMQKAAGGGMAEVEWGKLAQEHGSSAEVKRIGETLEKDHSEANQKLKALAAEKGVSLPASIPQKEKALMEKMKQRSGTEFDRQFLQHQLKHHKEDIRHFEHASQRSEDADLKAFTTGTLPVLEKHEEMIREAAQGMHLKVDGTSARSRLRGDAASSEASHRGDGHHVDQTDVEALKREQEKHVDQTDVESGSRRSTGERDR